MSQRRSQSIAELPKKEYAEASFTPDQLRPRKRRKIVHSDHESTDSSSEGLTQSNGQTTRPRRMSLIHKNSDSHAQQPGSNVKEVDNSSLETANGPEVSVPEPLPKPVIDQDFQNSSFQDQFESSGPCPSSPDSVLETTIPTALNTEKDLSNEAAVAEEIPSTKPSNKGVTQVERTPWTILRAEKVPSTMLSIRDQDQSLLSSEDQSTMSALGPASIEKGTSDPAIKIGTDSQQSGDIADQARQNNCTMGYNDKNEASHDNVMLHDSSIDAASVNSSTNIVTPVKKNLFKYSHHLICKLDPPLIFCSQKWF